MSSPDPMLPANNRAFASRLRVSQRADHVLVDDYNDGKWPVWVRLVTIIGLSTGLWSAIIWAAVSIFG